MRVLLEYAGGSVELGSGETTVGRDLSCRIRFNDPAISRRHLRFVVAAGSVVVEDQGSRNGTLLNGRQLTGRHPVAGGDEIHIGGRTLRVRITGAEPVDPEEEAETRTHSRAREATPPGAAGAGVPREHNCPRCRARVPVENDRCPRCGHAWPSGRWSSPTRMLVPVDPDRRREPRRAVEVPVIYASQSLTFDAVARDVSSGGIFMATTLLDPVGTPCQVTVLADGAPALTLGGVVAHVVEEATEEGRPPGLGISFTSLDASSRRWLDDLLLRIDRMTPAPG